MKRAAIRNAGITAFVIAFAARFLFALFPSIYQGFYFYGIFPIIRQIQSFLGPIFIIPGYYIILIAFVIWLFFRLRKNRKLFMLRLANLLGAGIAVFLFLWGYNYLDEGISARMKLPETPESTDLSSHYLATMERAMAYRSQVEGIAELTDISAYENLPTDQEINSWVAAVLAEYGYPTESAIRIRHIKPEGALRRLNIAGIYNPYTGEANVDAALVSLRHIFTAAHEVAHAYGVTGEADANFVAYLACLSSNEPIAMYAAEYALWRKIGGEINRSYPEETIHQLASLIPENLMIDRLAIIRESMNYPGYFPAVSDAINDTYLKIQGIESGTADYDNFLKIYLAWEAKNSALNIE